MKQGLSLRVSQHLALTPQLQQSIRLLQLSTLELNQEIEQMLDENPFLERSEDSAEREAFGLERADQPVAVGEREHEAAASSSNDASPGEAGDDEPDTSPDWEGDGSMDMSPDDTEWGTDAGAAVSAAREDGARDAGEWSSTAPSLQDHLRQQATALRLSPQERAALEFLIGSLNPDGYLEDDLGALALALAGPHAEPGSGMLDELMQDLRLALRLLQSMDPAGVGAASLAECLRLQLNLHRQAGAEPDEEALTTALALCELPLEMLARRDLRRLSLTCAMPEAAVKRAMALIARLDPRPGRRFEPTEPLTVVPDVIVTRSGSGAQTRFRVQLNEEVMPRLRVYEAYADLLKGRKGQQGLQSRLQEARWFIKNIRQRFDTILRVSRAIVERQKNFFVHGELAMRPLVLREIADELGLHESTISRVTTAKYMATPMGTYELKFFFGSALGTETGGNASSTAVRALIRQIVANETPGLPLSDNQISEMLKEQGIECARRTVAKYREALRIAPASLRKNP